MHRTQIMLEEAHYRFLQREARRLRVSMSEILRRLVAREMPSASGEPADPFEGVAGIVDTGGGLPEEAQDRIIYSGPRR